MGCLEVLDQGNASIPPLDQEEDAVLEKPKKKKGRGQAKKRQDVFVGIYSSYLQVNRSISPDRHRKLRSRSRRPRRRYY